MKIKPLALTQNQAHDLLSEVPVHSILFRQINNQLWLSLKDHCGNIQDIPIFEEQGMSLSDLYSWYKFSGYAIINARPQEEKELEAAYHCTASFPGEKYKSVLNNLFLLQPLFKIN